MSTELTKEAQAVIENYLKLPLPVKVKCPYYNNNRGKIRAGLRALIGKGSPEEIADEVTLIALKDHIDLANLSEQKMTEFLVDRKIGVDCSGYVYHILNAEIFSKRHKHLAKIIKYPKSKKILGQIRGFIKSMFVARLRPAENINVSVLSNNQNSKIVDLADISAGDFLTMVHFEPERKIFNHIILITKVEESFGGKGKKKIHYTHSIAWPEDGKYSHGISNGHILLENSTDGISPSDLTDGEWFEKDVPDSANRTKFRAVSATHSELRRIL